jgi:hypothetical protein
MRYSGIQFDPEIVAAFVKLPREVLTGKSNIEEAETEAEELTEVEAG